MIAQKEADFINSYIKVGGAVDAGCSLLVFDARSCYNILALTVKDDNLWG